MARIPTMISIDEGLKKKAKEAQIEISGIVDAAIKNKLNMKEIQIKDMCEFCNQEGPKETVQTIIDSNPRALTWLCPDEKWICNSCLEHKKGNVL